MKKFNIVTFNIRTLYDTKDDKNCFIHRAGMILEKIDKEKPHVICFQETSEKIKVFLKKYLKDYVLIGVGRLEDYSDEGLCIAYLKDEVEILSLEHFWLSPTPYVPGSRYEIQSEYPRICQRVIVKVNNMKTPVQAYNVHLDHRSDAARIEGIKQIMEGIYENKEKYPFPTFIMGDFNAYEDSDTIKYCKEYDKYKMIDISEKSGKTFHNFGGNGLDNKATGRKIDYIFADIETSKRKYTITKWEDTKNDIYLSDHYPMACEIEID